MEWTLEHLNETLNRLRTYGSEEPRLEIKKATEGYPTSIAETLCAFSNMPDGGTLICGIDEAENFSVVGVYDIDELEKSIASALRNSLTPKGSATFDRITVGDAAVLIVSVAPLPLVDRPCYYRGKAYMRYSDGDYAMDDYEITRVLAARERRQHDLEAVAHTSPEDLDRRYTEKFVSAARHTSQRLSQIDDKVVLARKSVTTADHRQLTLAGLYALGNYPQQFYPALKVSGWVEDEVLRNADKLEADGPLVEMLEQTLQWLVRNLRFSVVSDGQGGLKNQPEIPLIVLRELVANALVHRALDADTAYAKDVVIRVYRNRIVITNPGGLWAVTTANLAQPGRKTAVNSALYEICKLAQISDGSRVIEGEGNGIFEAQKAMRQAGLPPLEFVDKGFQFTVIIRRPSMDVQKDEVAQLLESGQDGAPLELAETEQKIYSYLLQGGDRTVAEIMEGLQLTRRQVAYNLGKLKDTGLISSSHVPGKRGAVYGVAG